MLTLTGLASRQQPPSLPYDWPSRGNIQMRPWLIGPQPVSTVRRTHFHSDITSVWHTLLGRLPRWDAGGCAENTIGEIIFYTGVESEVQLDGAGSMKWIYLRRVPVRIAKSVARLLLRAKYAFRAGEQPISRGEPKINKPYDKTKLCKTLIMLLISFFFFFLMCRGHCVGSWKMLLSAGNV